MLQFRPILSNMSQIFILNLNKYIRIKITYNVYFLFFYSNVQCLWVVVIFRYMLLVPLSSWNDGSSNPWGYLSLLSLLDNLWYALEPSGYLRVGQWSSSWISRNLIWFTKKFMEWLWVLKWDEVCGTYYFYNCIKLFILFLKLQ